MPPKQRNTNALTHGMASGVLPAGCSHVVKQLNTFREVIERAAIERRGELDAFTIAGIQTAVSWYRHALLARRWLKNAFDELSHDQRLHFSREEARALAERDKTLKSLGLDRCEHDGPGTLYATLPDVPDDDAADGEQAGPEAPA
jgi:hypothetical protein